MVQKVGVLATQTHDLCLVLRSTERRREQTHKSLFCDFHRSVMACVCLNTQLSHSEKEGEREERRRRRRRREKRRRPFQDMFSFIQRKYDSQQLPLPYLEKARMFEWFYQQILIEYLKRFATVLIDSKYQ